MHMIDIGWELCCTLVYHNTADREVIIHIQKSQEIDEDDNKYKQTYAVDFIMLLLLK